MKIGMNWATRGLVSTVAIGAIFLGSAFAQPAIASTADATISTPTELPDLPEIPDSANEIIGALDQWAEGDRDSYRYVWYDHDTDKIVLDVLDSGGAERAAANVDWPEGAVIFRTVESSRTALSAAVNDLIEDDAVVEAHVDNEANAVVAVVDAAPEVTPTIGDDQDVEVLVEVDGNLEGAAPASTGRLSDDSPYYGGARTVNPGGGGYSSGIPWRNGSAQYMLTAGHCTPNGGTTKSASGATMGSVTSGTRENWAAGFGTTWMSGDNQYRGDLALITISSPQTVAARIYRGGTSSTSSSIIDRKWHRSPQTGDQFCSGGTRSGELCGWVVRATNVTFEYSNGEILRGGFRATRAGACIIGGDSGGPVFTVQSDGKLAAKGIISGSNGSSTNCTAWFTDVWHATYMWPGNVATG